MSCIASLLLILPHAAHRPVNPSAQSDSWRKSGNTHHEMEGPHGLRQLQCDNDTTTRQCLVSCGRETQLDGVEGK
ncbi:hypothetical protein IWX92DRAFT_371399 [Phyllosticta citricarpa]